MKSQLASLEKEDCGFISSRDIFSIVKWRVVTSMQSQDDIQSSGVYIYIYICMRVTSEYIYTFSFSSQVFKGNI